MLTSFKVTITADNMEAFFKSLQTLSSRKAIADILASGNLDWSSYWELPLDARKAFVSALLCANIFPTPQELKKIFLEENRRAVLTLILMNSRIKYWIPTEPICSIIRETFKILTSNEYDKIYKKLNIEYLVWYSASQQLPLLISDKRWEKYEKNQGIVNLNRLKELFERRLKDE
jgi:hypothetical protein